jgi:prepilin-type N-terminal cleavage/methylation domain-containing protein
MRGRSSVADHDRRAHAGLNRDDRSAGFGLIELIVALMILSVGLLALTGAAAVAQRSLVGAQALEEGVDAAALVLDSLMRDPAPAAGARWAGRTRVQWSVEPDSIADMIRLTVTVRDGTRERQLTFHASHRAR